MPFNFSRLDLPEAILIEPRLFADGRGWFMESYKKSDFEQAGITVPFVQQNQPLSETGTLRGLHFQHQPKAQGKLVRVLSGEIFDVAVDIRRNSPTCGRWIGVTLSAENRKMLFVPPWCAHGFYVSRGPAEVLYMTTDEYSKPHESGFLWDDPRFGIDWPGQPEFLADRDRQWPAFEPVDWAELNGDAS
jgi:dTDP-4-dehydrorhamnose 3,5-epimerase